MGFKQNVATAGLLGPAALGLLMWGIAQTGFVWPDWAINGAIFFGSIGVLVFAALSLQIAYVWIQGHQSGDLKIRNAKLIFDPNGLTEIYVRFEVLNLGPDILITELFLKITDHLGPVATLTPRVEGTGKQIHQSNPNPGRPPAIYCEKFSDRAITHMELLPNCSAIFTVSGNAKALYGIPRNKFALIAKDATGKTYSAPLTL